MTSDPLQEREIRFSGPVGRLEGLLAEGAFDGAAALLALHPHPLYGGTMDNNVVKAVVRAGHAAGFATLRFNFRGAGFSEGGYDNGVGEQDDVGAALDFMEQRLRPKIKILVGYSFGACIALAYCHRPHHGVDSLVLIAPPPFLLDKSLSLGLPVVEKILLGQHDKIAPPEEVASRASASGVQDRIDVIASTDHFFSGREAEIEHRLSGLLAAWKQGYGR